MTPEQIAGLGKRPIDGPAPAGQDVRDDAAFDQLEAEVGKLSSPVHSASLDWKKVTVLSSGLLETKGKDVLVACYLSSGLLETRSLPGLADGLAVLADMLETYWDTLYPPLKRIRGRRNALQWLIDRVQQRATELNWSEIAPQEEALVARLTASLTAIDAVLVEKDDEAPSMRALLSLVRGLPVIEAPAPESTPAAASATAAATATASSTATSAAASAAASASAAPVDSAAQAERALDDTCTRLGSIGEWLLTDNSANPLAYRLHRLAAWTALTALPPADGGQTRLRAPISQVIDVLGRLKAAQSDADIVQFAEAQLQIFPFWLDLNFLCDEALDRLGEKFAGARREVRGESARLVARLPGVEQLAFAGGMPFADGDTLAWLATLGSGSGGAASGGSSAGARRDAVTTAIANARTLAATDDVTAAAAALQEQLAQQPPARDQLLLQIRLCELLLQHRPGAALRGFALGVIDTIDKHHLGTWDPALARDGLQVAYGVMTRNAEDQALADAILKRLVAVDAGAAVKLVTGT